MNANAQYAKRCSFCAVGRCPHKPKEGFGRLGPLTNSRSISRSIVRGRSAVRLDRFHLVNREIQRLGVCCVLFRSRKVIYPLLPRNMLISRNSHF